MKNRECTIPKRWKKVSINDVILDIGDGGTPPRNKTEYFSGNIPWVVVKDIRPKIKVTSDSLSAEGLKKSSAKLWPKETVILSFGATIGEVGIAEVELATKQGIAGIVPNQSKITSEFLYYFLSTQKNKLSQLASGSTIKEVRPNVIKKIKLLLPSIPEQKKIAEILACVDEDIEKMDEIIKKTQKLKKGLMQELLSKGIGHNEFKKTELGEIPKGWEIKKIKDVCEVASGSTPKTFNKTYWDGDTVWVTPADLSKRKSKYFYDSDRHITREGFENCSTVLIPKGSLIMSSRAPIGYLTINTVEATTNQGCKSFICKSVDVEFLYYFFSYNIGSIKNLGSGSTFLEVGRKSLEKIDIILPSIKEQKQIAEILSAVDDKIDIYKQIKLKLTELKKGLMQDLLSGEVRV